MSLQPPRPVLQTNSPVGQATNASLMNGSAMSKMIVQMVSMRRTVGTRHAAVTTSLATTENASLRDGSAMGTMIVVITVMSWDVVSHISSFHNRTITTISTDDNDTSV